MKSHCYSSHMLSVRYISFQSFFIFWWVFSIYNSTVCLFIISLVLWGIPDCRVTLFYLDDGLICWYNFYSEWTLSGWIQEIQIQYDLLSATLDSAWTYTWWSENEILLQIRLDGCYFWRSKTWSVIPTPIPLINGMILLMGT